MFGYKPIQCLKFFSKTILIPQRLLEYLESAYIVTHWLLVHVYKYCRTSRDFQLCDAFWL